MKADVVNLKLEKVSEIELSNEIFANNLDVDFLSMHFSRMKKKTSSPKFNESNVGSSPVRKKTLQSPALKRALNFEKGYVPQWIWTANENTQWQYIRGLFYADGTVNVTNGKGNPFYLSITNTNKNFLEELQILLLNLVAYT